MTPDAAPAIIGVLGALVLVGAGVWRRSRSGEPMARWAAIWAAAIALLFAGALALDGRL